MDAQLAPTKCVGWSPAGVAAPPGWSAQWTTEGLTQVSVPLGGADFVAAAAVGLETAQEVLCASRSALPGEHLQVQLLMLRLCAGPQANYWLRALPLGDGVRLAGAVDRGAQRVFADLLCDARDDAATRAAVVQRAALPPRMGGLGIGGRTAVAPAAALASRVDALRAKLAYFPALRATADGLRRLPGAGGEPAVCPVGVAGGTRVAPASVDGAARRADALSQLRARRVTRPAAEGPRPPQVCVARGAVAGAAFPWTAGRGAWGAPPAYPAFNVRRAGGVAARRFEAPPAEATRPRVVSRHPGVRRQRSIPAPPPLTPPDDADGASLQSVGRPAAPPVAPPPVPPTVAALCGELLDLRHAVRAHAVAPDTGLLWARSRSSARGAQRADALSPLLPHEPECGSGANPDPACGQQGPELLSVPSWREMLGRNGDHVAQRDLSLPARVARRARIYRELSLWGRAGMAACQGQRAALWFSALPAPGAGGRAIPSAAMRAAVRLWLGVAPRSASPAPRCRCGAYVDADGRHFHSACPLQELRRERLHHHIVGLLAAALRRAPDWEDVVVEAGLDDAHSVLRPDLRANHGTSGDVTWADASVAWPFAARLVAPVAGAPSRVVAREAREAAKSAKYSPCLPATATAHVYTPLVWEAFGRVAPATERWLTEAFRGPALAAVRAGHLRDVSIAIWRSHARGVADGYARCFGLETPPVGGACHCSGCKPTSGSNWRVGGSPRERRSGDVSFLRF